VLTARYCQLLWPLLTSLMLSRSTETSPGKDIIPSSDSCGIYSMKFAGRGRCEDVLTYPLHVASVYRFCSSVPEFAVSLPSVHASRHATLRLTNRLHQLACKGLTPSGINRYLSIPLPHAGRTHCICVVGNCATGI